MSSPVSKRPANSSSNPLVLSSSTVWASPNPRPTTRSSSRIPGCCVNFRGDLPRRDVRLHDAAAPTAPPSGCRPTTTWGTPRSATTPSAPAACSTRAPSWSTTRSQSGAILRGPPGADAGPRRGRPHVALHRPPLRRQRALPHPHLLALIDRAAADGVARSACTAPRRARRGASSAEHTSPTLEACIEQLQCRRRGTADVRVASGGGRMVTTMDRYGPTGRMVERGWQAHVLGADAARSTSAARGGGDVPPGGSREHRPVPASFVVADGRPARRAHR